MYLNFSNLQPPTCICMLFQKNDLPSMKLTRIWTQFHKNPTHCNSSPTCNKTHLVNKHKIDKHHINTPLGEWQQCHHHWQLMEGTIFRVNNKGHMHSHNLEMFPPNVFTYFFAPWYIISIKSTTWTCTMNSRQMSCNFHYFTWSNMKI
jgi:hypothetical protein